VDPIQILLAHPPSFLAEEVIKLRARVTELESALSSLYALVQGECPSLLEDDHHDGIVRSALHLD